ncbi:MAG: hypothetical protein LBI57_03435 [Helicobacteraceae bacterium]|jgi:hypothetical protein|nr:hypothetical protein [Helicobacteraceae bacterium]
MLSRLDLESKMIWEMFNLSISGGFAGINADYAVCRDYAKKYELDAIECWRAIKRMAGAYNKAGDKRGK